MKTTFGRTCLILALLSLSLAGALSVGLKAQNDRPTVQAHIFQAQVAGMQLQGSPDSDDDVAAAPEADESDRTAACTERDCVTPKQELALARIVQEPVLTRTDAPLPNESKAFVAPGDDVRPKSKD
jgi:hypothetical protein